MSVEAAPEKLAVGEQTSPKIERTLQQSIYEGCATILFMSWTSGAIVIGYLAYLGASPFQLALTATIPLLAQAVAPLAPWIQGQYPHPKKLVTIGAAIARFVWIFPIFLPFFLTAEDLQGNAATLILCMLAFSAIFQGIIGVIWSSWMGAVVPASRRGKYFGTRNGILAMIGVVASISGGIMLDRIPTPFNFQLVFFLAVLFAALGIYLYQGHFEPRGISPRISIRQSISIPLRDVNFRRYLRFAIYWQASLLIGMCLVFPYFITHLQLSFTQIAIYQVLAAVTTLIMAPVWGRIADRVGNKAVLAINTVIAGSLLPLCWLLATPGDPRMVWISGIVDGFAFSAINAAIFNLSLATTAPKWRSTYLAMMSMTTGAAGFLGGYFSAQLFVVVDRFRTEFIGLEMTGYHYLFIFSGLLRCGAFLFIHQIEETHAWKTRDVVRAVMGLRLSGFPWR